MADRLDLSLPEHRADVIVKEVESKSREHPTPIAPPHSQPIRVQDGNELLKRTDAFEKEKASVFLETMSSSRKQSFPASVAAILDFFRE